MDCNCSCTDTTTNVP